MKTLYKIFLINWLGDEYTYGYVYFANKEEAENYALKIAPAKWRCRIETVTENPFGTTEV